MFVERLKPFALALAGACLITAMSTADRARADDDPVRWKMASWFPARLPQVGTLGKAIEDKLERVSGGEIRVRFHEPGSLVPPSECFDSVSTGAVDACWAVSGYWFGKEPGLAVFSAVPFGPAWPEMLAWFYYGGGQEIYDAIYDEHNIKALVCGGTVPEASGWFKKEIRSVEDLRGLKMRFFGLGAKVMEKMGVSTQLLPAGDIFPALELGTIDATEFAMPSVDLQLGFHQVADYYYFPGWHQPATLYELIMNKEQWEALSDTQQAQFEMVCGDNVRQAIAEGEAAQVAALKELEEKGVQIREWSPEVLQALREKWEEVAKEISAEDARFKEAWDSLTAFRADYATWHRLGYIE
ncbi:TRAP transporter substrate-binding protein [Virgifigura deserti]|uniref:TRAP transporter substrate-binding protein n=1 Tax=Virgifigura deserti TaxID=2268457 RepID=UPI003CCC2677